MITFHYPDKRHKDALLPALFKILHENMRSIAPSGLPFEEEQASWLAAVSPALEKEPRKILLCLVDGQLAGFLQYYIRDNLLMIEELQLAREYQATMLFCGFCRYFLRNLPAEVRYIEAYADSRNLRSRKLMRRLGMEQVDDSTDSSFLHFRGRMADLLPVFRK